jgi:hypothetical protein
MHCTAPRQKIEGGGGWNSQSSRSSLAVSSLGSCWFSFSPSSHFVFAVTGISVLLQVDTLKTKLWIEFDGEVGLDYGGVAR